MRDRWPSAPPDVCRRCGQLTGGNPLQLRELLRAADGPGGTIDVDDVGDAAAVAARRLERFVLNRLAALPPPAQVLAEAVAVFEDEVPVHLAAALAQVDPTAAGVAVDELVRADVLAPRDPLGFRHPLLRAAVYGAIPAAAARRDARPGGAVVHGARGRPWSRWARTCCCRRSGGDAEVVETLRSAAGGPWAAAPGSAVQYLERALREPPPPMPGRRPRGAGACRSGDRSERGRAASRGGDAWSARGQRAELLLAFARALHHEAGWRRPARRFGAASTSCRTRGRSRANYGSRWRVAISTPRCSPRTGRGMHTSAH